MGKHRPKEVIEAEKRDHERYAMKRSEPVIRHDVLCSICGEIKTWGQFMPGDPPVCRDCDALKHGRATSTEKGTAVEENPKRIQLALFES